MKKHAITITACLLLAVSIRGEERGIAPFLPQPVSDNHFASLREQSPFTRSLNLSDSLILTGIATVEEESVATLLNKETNETFVVSGRTNSQGWKMVEVKENDDLEKVSATIAIDGGEVVTVRYAEWQLKPGEARPGAGRTEERKGGRKGDGKGKGFRGPPSEMREKMAKLSEEQRQKLFGAMMKLRQQKPDMSPEERRKVFEGYLNRITQSGGGR